VEGHANTRAKIDPGSKFAALIGKCVVIGLIKQPIRFSRRSFGEEYCVTSPKSVCVGGYSLWLLSKFGPVEANMCRVIAN